MFVVRDPKTGVEIATDQVEEAVALARVLGHTPAKKRAAVIQKMAADKDQLPLRFLRYLYDNGTHKEGVLVSTMASELGSTPKTIGQMARRDYRTKGAYVTKSSSKGTFYFPTKKLASLLKKAEQVKS